MNDLEKLLNSLPNGNYTFQKNSAGNIVPVLLFLEEEEELIHAGPSNGRSGLGYMLKAA
jgi:hypothetical protein